MGELTLTQEALSATLFYIAISTLKHSLEVLRPGLCGLMFVLKWINLSNYTYWVSRLRVSPKYNWQLFVVFVFFCMEVISIPKWGTCGSANIYPQKIYVTIFFVTVFILGHSEEVRSISCVGYFFLENGSVLFIYAYWLLADSVLPPNILSAFIFLEKFVLCIPWVKFQSWIMRD